MRKMQIKRPIMIEITDIAVVQTIMIG